MSLRYIFEQVSAYGQISRKLCVKIPNERIQRNGIKVEYFDPTYDRKLDATETLDILKRSEELDKIKNSAVETWKIRIQWLISIGAVAVKEDVDVDEHAMVYKVFINRKLEEYFLLRNPTMQIELKKTAEFLGYDYVPKKVVEDEVHHLIKQTVDRDYYFERKVHQDVFVALMTGQNVKGVSGDKISDDLRLYLPPVEASIVKNRIASKSRQRLLRSRLRQRRNDYEYQEQ